jgi:hypothetical protein
LQDAAIEAAAALPDDFGELEGHGERDIATYAR